MANDYYNHGSSPAQGSNLTSGVIRAEFDAIQAAADKLVPLAGNGSKVVVINATATGQDAVGTTGIGNFVRATSPIIDLSNATGLPATTGLAGIGAGVAAFLTTPSSANLAAALTDETGTGENVFATNPTITSANLVTPALGTPASGVATNLTGLPLGTGVVGLLPVDKGGTGQSSGYKQSSPFRNRIINGTLKVSNRLGEGNFLIPVRGYAYFRDRWFATAITNSTIINNTLNPTPYFSTALDLGGSAYTRADIGTRIESSNIYDLASSTVTLAVRIQSAVTVTWVAYYANSINAFGTFVSPTKTQIATGTFAASPGVISTFATQIALPANAANGIEILFQAPNGGCNYHQVQLESGTISASDVVFENVDIQLEQQRCKYYYQRVGTSARGPASAGAQTFDSPVVFSEMRETPTVTLQTSGPVANATKSIFITSAFSGRFEIISTSAGDCYSLDNTYALESEIP